MQNSDINNDKRNALPKNLLSRRAMFNTQQNLVAYELQLDSRSSDDFFSSEYNTADLLLQLVEADLGAVNDNVQIFVPIGKSYIQAGLPVIENSRNIIFEVPDGLLDDSEKSSFFQSIYRDDIRFAWMQPKPGNVDSELLQYIEYVIIDLAMHTPSQVRALVQFYKPHGIKLIADNVSTPQIFDQCIALGFDHFMGYFFCMPGSIEQTQLPISKMIALQLICELQNPDNDVEKIKEIIEKDVSMTYRVLRYINSPLFYLPKEIDSIKKAILIAGLDTIKILAVIVAHARLPDKPPELFKVALMRARMAKTMSEEYALSTDKMFLLGLLTTLDALTDMSMEKVVHSLPLSDDIRSILVGYANNKDNSMAKLLNAIVCFEKSDWAGFEATGFDIHSMRNHYWRAASWVSEVVEILHAPPLAKVG